MSNTINEVVDEIVEVDGQVEVTEVEVKTNPIVKFTKKHPFWTGVITATGVGAVIVGGAFVAAAIKNANADADSDFDIDDTIDIDTIDVDVTEI